MGYEDAAKILELSAEDELKILREENRTLKIKCDMQEQMLNGMRLIAVQLADAFDLIQVRQKEYILIPQPKETPIEAAMRINEAQIHARDTGSGRFVNKIPSRMRIPPAIQEALTAVGRTYSRKLVMPQDRHRMIELYQDGWSIVRIADELGFMQLTVRRHLIRAGVHDPSKTITVEKRKVITDQFIEGNTVTKIARNMHLSPGVVSDVLCDAGLLIHKKDSRVRAS